MSITRKELARKLGISATAVSLALNNRPGVSTETRRKVMEAAIKYGYDFGGNKDSHSDNSEICFVSFQEQEVILDYHDHYFEMMKGMEEECRKNGFHLISMQVQNIPEDIQQSLETLSRSNVAGILLFGTENSKEIYPQYLSLDKPTVTIDSSFDIADCSNVAINNAQGAYLATRYLIEERKSQPGRISSIGCKE